VIFQLDIESCFILTVDPADTATLVVFADFGAKNLANPVRGVTKDGARVCFAWFDPVATAADRLVASARPRTEALQDSLVFVTIIEESEIRRGVDAVSCFASVADFSRFGGPVRCDEQRPPVVVFLWPFNFVSDGCTLTFPDNKGTATDFFIGWTI
jgi:hypothetical protein